MLNVASENRPLTAIRGFASVWVVAHHWVQWPLAVSVVTRLGYRAVDLFFVLSGMILCAVYRDLDARGLPHFWLKRLLRIFPLHLFALAACILILAWPAWDAATWHRLATWSLAGSAALLQSFVHLDAPINPPAWSAGIELLCYAAFPVALVLLRQAWPRWIVLAAVAALGYAEYRTAATYRGDIAGTGALLRGLYGFCLGMALWRLATVAPATGWLATAAESLGLLGLAATIGFDRPALMPLACGLLLFGLLFDRGIIARCLRSEPCVWLGRISFSLYLLQYPMLYLADRVAPAPASLAAYWLRFAVMLAGLCAVSTLTYRFIETPGRRLPSLLAGRAAGGRAIPMPPASCHPDAVAALAGLRPPGP